MTSGLVNASFSLPVKMIFFAPCNPDSDHPQRNTFWINFILLHWENVLHLSLHPQWITFSLICVILHIIYSLQHHSIINNIIVYNNRFRTDPKLNTFSIHFSKTIISFSRLKLSNRWSIETFKNTGTKLLSWWAANVWSRLNKIWPKRKRSHL